MGFKTGEERGARQGFELVPDGSSVQQVRGVGVMSHGMSVRRGSFMLATVLLIFTNDLSPTI